MNGWPNGITYLLHGIQQYLPRGYFIKSKRITGSNFHYMLSSGQMSTEEYLYGKILRSPQILLWLITVNFFAITFLNVRLSGLGEQHPSFLQELLCTPDTSAQESSKSNPSSRKKGQKTSCAVKRNKNEDTLFYRQGRHYRCRSQNFKNVKDEI